MIWMGMCHSVVMTIIHYSVLIVLLLIDTAAAAAADADDGGAASSPLSVLVYRLHPTSAMDMKKGA